MGNIKSKDLRIGNLLTSKSWGGYHPVSGIEVFRSHFEVKIGGYIHKISDDAQVDLDTIPLDKSDLIKFGFVKEECFYYKNGVAIEDDFTLEGFGDVELKYVHQLQNLYFALTGEELVMKDELTLK
ncbi:hypothetical protein [Brumimicrobium mesophilum]|uniref:hypothetical protein n=1 Tax=Brumimicrobium mesophilum TaxID=392717 RepID=UPI000D13F993|nr:hypothetical protein [Brumimicrobium mesophilum]